MRRRRIVLWAAFVAAAGLVAWACNGTNGSLGAGDACHSSTECGPGLVCDFNQSPAVCAGHLTPVPDGAVVPDAPPDTPDSAPLPDTPPGTPDAGIDAAVPDAAVPDADLPDADLPDA